MKRIWSIFKAGILTTYREPYLLVFDLLFPIVLFFFMASVFVPSREAFTFDLYLYTSAPSNLLEQVTRELEPNIRSHWVPREYSDVKASLQYVKEDALRRGRSPALVRFPGDWEERLGRGEPFAIDAYSSDEQLFYAAIGGLQDKLLEASGQRQISPIAVKAHSFDEKKSPAVNDVVLRVLLSFWLISGGMHAVSQYIYLSTSGLSKKMLTSPLRKFELILELLMEPLVVTLLVSIAVLVLAVLRYQANLLEQYAVIALLALSLVVLVTFSASLGLLIASLAREPTQGTMGPLVVYMGLMFFSGFAIPVDFFPDFLRVVADWLPPRQLALVLSNAIEHGYYDLRLFGSAALAALVMLIITIGIMPWKAERR